MPFQIKRIYAPAEPADGERILVDRLWPRGVSKERAALTQWMKEIAPSPALREWFGHQPERFAAFKEAYKKELETDPEKRQAMDTLLQLAKGHTVTLLYGAKDPQINQAVVLADCLRTKGA